MTKILLVGLLALLSLIGCENSTKAKNSLVSNVNHVQGIVADRDGPVTTGKIVVTDKNGKTITTVNLNNSASYSLDLPADTDYPVVLTCPAADEVLEAVIVDASVVQQDITHMSSLVVRSARDLGGINKENMVRAAGNAI
ncbi:MAG: hypothetical protein ABL925_14850, partial [Methylococcales bacterium]